LCYLWTNKSTISIYVNLFLCLEFYSKILIERLGYFVYNSNRPTGRLLDSGFRLIDYFADWYQYMLQQNTPFYMNLKQLFCHIYKKIWYQIVLSLAIYNHKYTISYCVYVKQMQSLNCFQTTLSHTSTIFLFLFSDQRKAESTKIRDKYPERIPVNWNFSLKIS